MRDLSDSRDVSPRIGTPLWTYLTTVTVAGLAVLAVAIAGLPGTGFVSLLDQPLLWVLVALALVGQLRPIVTPVTSGPDSPAASLTFCFATLLYWGFPAAALMSAATVAAASLLARPPVFRVMFNIAQYTLALGAAGLVLAAAGIHPAPLAPWVPASGDLLAVALAALAYFIVNFVLVSVAVALHQRAPIRGSARRALPYQAFVSLVLLSAAPLVVVVMAHSAVFALLFLLPLIAIHANAALTMQREHQVHHDELTGLANRTLLLRQTAQALTNAAVAGQRAGFLLLDLDRFKEVNDTLGHAAGDALLRVVAARLARSVRPGDVVARLGGDEFGVLLPSIRDGAAAQDVGVRLRAALAEPIHVEAMALEVEASVGVALYPDDATGVEVLLQRADVAMYLAKERRTGVEMYACEADRNSPVRLSLLGDLRRGLENGELELHYQPKVSLAHGRTVGMEALVRWRHPRRGLVLPDEFLPLAEQSYLLPDLTGFVLDTAIAQAVRWRANGLSVQVCVNLAGRDLLDARLAARAERGLRSHDLAPEGLMLEISERVLAGGPAPAVLTALARLGVPISLDDFGTGYTALAGPRSMAVQEVKIGPSLISGLPGSSDSQLVVRSLVELVRALGIRSVAEGVETDGEAAALRHLGCDAAQGRYFSEPLEVSAATAWLAGHLQPVTGAGPGGSVGMPVRAQPAQRAAPSLATRSRARSAGGAARSA